MNVLKGKLPMWIIIIAIVGYLVFDHFSKNEKTGYIIVQDVYNQFALKKDMQMRYGKSHDARKRILDSMAVNIKVLGERIDMEKGKDTSDIREFRMKRMEYYERGKQLNEDDSAQLKQCDNEILSQLNQYIKDYGRENHYQYIFGNGNSGLVTADDSKNITAQVTEYVNERYAGKK